MSSMLRGLPNYHWPQLHAWATAVFTTTHWTEVLLQAVTTACVHLFVQYPEHRADVARLCMLAPITGQHFVGLDVPAPMELFKARAAASSRPVHVLAAQSGLLQPTDLKAVLHYLQSTEALPYSELLTYGVQLLPVVDCCVCMQANVLWPVELHCGHKFCAKCLRTWFFASHGTCPCCRARVMDDVLAAVRVVPAPVTNPFAGIPAAAAVVSSHLHVNGNARFAEQIGTWRRPVLSYSVYIPHFDGIAITNFGLQSSEVFIDDLINGMLTESDEDEAVIAGGADDTSYLLSLFGETDYN